MVLKDFECKIDAFKCKMYRPQVLFFIVPALKWDK